MSPTQAGFSRVVRSCSIFSLLVAGSACISAGSPDWVAQRAVIENPPAEPLSLTLPATIRAGVAITATLRTIGGRYCTRLGPTDVTAAGMLVTLEPYDSTYVGDLVCPSLPWHFLHTVEITFPATGIATLRVMGLQAGSPNVVTMDTVVEVQ